MTKSGLLETIKQEMWKGFTKKEVEVGGRKWTLKSLNDGESTWKDKFVPASATYGFVTAQKAPTVAVSLVAIDGVGVKELFLGEGEKPLTDSTVKTWLRMIGFSSIDERYEAAQRVYEFISELPPEIVDTLYRECLEIEKARKEAVTELLKNV